MYFIKIICSWCQPYRNLARCGCNQKSSWLFDPKTRYRILLQHIENPTYGMDGFSCVSILDWLDTILSFDFTVTYKKGIENILPDALSRLYQMSEQQEGETEDKDEEMVGEKQILFNSAELKVDGTQPEKFTVKFLKTMEERFGKRDVGNEQERLKLVVKVHNEAHVAGPGLYQKIFRDGYYWPGMWSMCHDVAANCLTCLKFNVGKVGFHPISPVTASLPMDMIAWDFAGPFKKTDDGYEYVLVIVDIASRFMILRKLKTKQMEEVAMVLLEVFADFGVPKSVQHDQDPLFMNQVLDRLKQMIKPPQEKLTLNF